MRGDPLSAPRYYDAEYETAAHERVEREQLRRLSAHLSRASRSRFYQQKLGQELQSLSENFNVGHFHNLPVTRKHELVEDAQQFPPYGSKLLASSQELVGVIQTSGTSGKGKETHVFTEEDRDRIVQIEACGFRWAGVRKGSVVALTLPISMGAAGLWWYTGLASLGANTLRLGLQTAAEKLQYMVDFQVDTLVATPAYITRLEAYASGEGIALPSALPSLKAIVMAGESKSARWVRDREEAWEATIYEQWGCSAGAVAWCCEGGMRDGEELRMMHGLPQWTYLEVIDPETGKHVEEGEFGELVITPLEVVGAPLVRFATGDRVRFRSWRSCSCRRPFDGFEAGSVSRYDDMVKVKGVNLWPSAVATVIDSHSTVMDHFVKISTDDEGREKIDVALEFDQGIGNTLRDRITASVKTELRAATGLGFSVSAFRQPWEKVDKESGKVRRWQDLRDMRSTTVAEA